MSDKDKQEPRGFGEHARGIAGEKAHEQGWGLNEVERTKLPEGAQNTYGGDDYDYGARDFGDEPVNVGAVSSKDADTAQHVQGKEKM